MLDWQRQICGRSTDSSKDSLVRKLSTDLSLRITVVDDVKEPMRIHGLQKLGRELGPPFRGASLGEIDNGEISIFHCRNDLRYQSEL
jgi:hypothetical protein